MIKLYIIKQVSRGLEWYYIADEVIGMKGFGASGKGEMLFNHFGFSVENILKVAKTLCKK